LEDNVNGFFIYYANCLQQQQMEQVSLFHPTSFPKQQL